jgi:hypothetical protein
MKNKIIILLLVLSAGWFQLLPANAQDVGTSLNLVELNKSISLLDEAISLKEKGQIVKAKRKGLEALKNFDQLFKKNVTITTTKECAFRRIKDYNDENFLTREFGLSCAFESSGRCGNIENPRLKFIFVSSVDGYKSEFDKTSWTTSNITEFFESSEYFIGTVKIVEITIPFRSQKRTYSISNHYGDDIIFVNCKILNLTLINQPPITEKANNINSSEDAPENVLQKLESGQDVPKEKIIKALRSLINESK